MLATALRFVGQGSYSRSVILRPFSRPHLAGARAHSSFEPFGAAGGSPITFNLNGGGEVSKGDKQPLHHDKGGEKYDYDLVVVGGGSGGLAAAKQAGKLGAKVACLDFVDPSPQGTTWGLGGTCVNVGCIPKKIMHGAALYGEAVKEAHHLGWVLPGAEGGSAAAVGHDWERMVRGVQQHIKSLNFGYRSALMDNRVKYINSKGAFLDAHTIKCTDKKGKSTTITSQNFVVAVGGRPRYLDIPGSAHCITSDDIFSLKKSPGRTLLVGASYVSLECAGFLTGLGLDATVMMRSIPLRGFDQQMAGRIVDYMKSTGTAFIHGAVPTNIEKLPDGRLLVEHRNPDSGETAEGIYDTVMQAVGRDPNTMDLGLANAGVEVDKFGRILVEKEQTSASNIYAVGDCIQPRSDVGPGAVLELTPVAIQAGTLVSRRLFAGSDVPMDYSNVPTAVFTPIEYGFVGLSEEAALGLYGEDSIEVYHTEYQPVVWAPLEKGLGACYMKVVCNKADRMRILGMHVLGPEAGEQVQGFTLGVKLGATFDDLANMVGIHPTNAEFFTTLKITKSSGESPAVTGC